MGRAPAARVTPASGYAVTPETETVLIAVGSAAGVGAAGALGQGGACGQGVGHEIGHAHLFAGERHGAGVDPREREQVIDHRGHPVGLGLDAGRVGTLGGSDSVLDRLGHGADPGQGGA